MALSTVINGQRVELSDDPDTPLLGVLRDTLGLTGTKFGCGIAHCGACTVMVDGNAIRSCVTPLARVSGKSLTTIEDLSSGNTPPLQQPLMQEPTQQCGY